MRSRSTGTARTTSGGGAPKQEPRSESLESQVSWRTPDLVLAFATAIAKPGRPALLLDSDNKNDGWTSVDGAVASGRAFALQVQDEVLALDADRPDLSRALEDMAAQMREEGLRPVVVASGQDDHRHLFCRIADPDRRERQLDRGLVSRRAAQSGERGWPKGPRTEESKEVYLGSLAEGSGPSGRSAADPKS